MRTSDASLCAILSRETGLGAFSRYALVSMRTRFDTVEWFVTDVERICETTGNPEVAMQGDEATCRAFIARPDADEQAMEAAYWGSLDDPA